MIQEEEIRSKNSQKQKSQRKKTAHITREGRKRIRKQHSLLVSALKYPDTHTCTYQCDNGTLSSELCGAEQRPDEAVDLFLLRVVFLIIRRNLRLLEPKTINKTFDLNVYQNGDTCCLQRHSLISENSF